MTPELITGIAVVASSTMTGLLTYWGTVRKLKGESNAEAKASWRADFQAIVDALQDDNRNLRERIAELAGEVSSLQKERMRLTEEVEQLKKLIVKIQNQDHV